MKAVFISLLSAVLVLTGSFVLLEATAQGYAYLVAGRGKRFQPDERLGWVPIPNLDIRRRNSDGDFYNLRTNDRSIRGPCCFPSPDGRRQLLILGDSFAFGEGVGVNERFDVVFSDLREDFAVLNLGVPGYGTDQQVIAATEHLKYLREDDVVLVLVYGNDFLDVARSRHSGRSKPWYELSGETLIRHEPQIGFLERLRDLSYVFSILAARLESDPRYVNRLSESLQLVENLIRRLAELVDGQGAKLWVVSHGLERFDLPFETEQLRDAICRYSEQCLDLDDFLGRPEYFLSDGHWTASGHRVVSDVLAQRL